jgi:hypothetical protein
LENTKEDLGIDGRMPLKGVFEILTVDWGHLALGRVSQEPSVTLVFEFQLLPRMEKF